MLASTWRRYSLRVLSIAVITGIVCPSVYAHDPEVAHPAYGNGFAELKGKLGDEMGEPITFEYPGQEPDSVVQQTTTGMAYWSPDHTPSFSDGFHRATLRNGVIIRWDGDADDPPPNSPTWFGGGSIATSAPMGSVWDRLASCESENQWQINTGNGYYGGIQEDMTFWKNYGGMKYASRPDLATRSQQIDVAIKGQAAQGWSAWPACSRRLGLR
jgi:hypothetical protein